jgi:hypothetical protein
VAAAFHLSSTSEPGGILAVSIPTGGKPAHVLVRLDRARGGFVLALIATVVPCAWLRRATVFCCALAALWPTSLGALRLFIDWVSFNADYLNSVWIAAVPALIGAAAISYFAPSEWVQRTWTSWLMIVPIAGLIVLGYSLQQYFVR